MAAKKRGGRAPSGGGLWAPKLGIVSLRVFTGAVMFSAAWYKLVTPGTGLGDTINNFAEREYIPLVRQAIAHPPTVLGWRMDWFSSLLENVFLPGQSPYVFGAAILFFEGLLGISLILGVCTRLMSVLGAFLMLGFGLAKGLPFLTVTKGTNWFLVMILFTLALTAAGRILGLDGRLQHRFPRWIS